MSAASEVKEDRKFTKEHEWALLVDGSVQVGITAFAVDQLGDVTLVTFDVAAGDAVEAGKPFGTIESVKTLSDLFAPISGTVVALNDALEDQPELVNEDCWGKGWMIRIQPKQASDVDGLLDASGYSKFLAESDH